MKYSNTTKKEVHQRGEAGAYIIEAALVLPIIVFCIFTLFDFSFILFQNQTFVHRARTAVRYGAIYPSSLTAIQNIVLYGQTSGSGAGLFGLLASNVSVTRTGEGTTADRITVVISNFQFNRITPGWSGPIVGKPITASITVEN
jgi:Flp pilus assembly protein TadG